MKVKVIDDNEETAFQRIRDIKLLNMFTDVQWIWERSIERLCDVIEPDDIVVLDVNLGNLGLGEEAGFDVFLKILEKYGADAELPMSIVFASVEPCRKRLEKRLDESLKQRLSNLHEIRQVVFAQDDFGGDIYDAMRHVLGFSIQQATEILFKPFQALHVDMQFIRANPEATSTDFDWDYYAQLPDKLKRAEKYLTTRLSRYVELFGCADKLTPIRQYLNGALAKLCQTFESDIASEELSKRLVQLVSDSGESAKFLEEFQAAVDAIKAIDAHKL